MRRPQFTGLVSAIHTVDMIGFSPSRLQEMYSQQLRIVEEVDNVIWIPVKDLRTNGIVRDEFRMLVEDQIRL